MTGGPQEGPDEPAGLGDALALARALAIESFELQDAVLCNAVVVRLRRLAHAHPRNRTLALMLATALENLTQCDLACEASTGIADELEQLWHRFDRSDELARHLAAALRNTAVAATEFAQRLALAERIQVLQERKPADYAVAAQLVAAWRGAFWRTADPAEQAALLQRMAAIEERFPEHPEIAFDLFCARYRAALCEPEDTLRQPQFERLAARAAAVPGSQKLASCVPLARRGAALTADGNVLVRDFGGAPDRAAEQLAAIEGELATLGEVRGPAVRDVLQRCPGLRAVLAAMPLHAVVLNLLAGEAFPIACYLFDKRPGNNWVVAAHQDLALPVASRVEARGFTGWTTKGGVAHVLPPDRVLRQLLVLRLHLDDCPADQGALAVLPGSHRGGRRSPAELAALRAEQFTVVPANRGDLLMMRPLLVHRSAPAANAGRRRVLHVVYASGHPSPLRWRT